MSLLHAKCEKEIAELKQQLKNYELSIKELNTKVKKVNSEFATLKGKNNKKVTDLNKKIKDMKNDLESKSGKIEDLETEIFLKENAKEQLEDYSKTIKKIANIISPTDYKIIEAISSLDDEKFSELIENERLPDVKVILNISDSHGAYTMDAINRFIGDMATKLSAILVDIELEEIVTNKNNSIIKFKSQYRNSFENITTTIVNFCNTHFYVTYKATSAYGTRYTQTDQARKSIILKNSKKDKILELDLVGY